MAKVIVGMSGGVDSAVAALLLKEQGYDVIGVTLRTWVSSDGLESRCCEIDDAREVCRRLGIPFHAFNCVSAFEERILRPFISDYINGLTPNPCVFCNREIKWERLIHYADILKADYVATGHYASVVKLPNGRFTVKKALHAEKDQTYMLYRLSQEQLARTLMPLADLSKQEVREIAEREGLPVARKPDSQEICFVPDGDYAGFIDRNSESGVPGPGPFVDESGRVLGTHKGITHYTIGQRKGLRIAFGTPMFVKQIRADRNEIVLGTEESLGARTVFCSDVNWMGVPEPENGQKIRGIVKIRYRNEGRSAWIEAGTEQSARICFEEPVRAAAPGQSAVFYDEEGCLIGGGIIRSAEA